MPCPWISEVGIAEGGVVNTQAATLNGHLAIDSTGTFTGVPSDGQTLTIGSVTYTFKASLSGGGAPFEVLIDASAAGNATNLNAAINDSGGEGTIYGNGTTANPATGSTVASATITLGTDVYLAESVSNFSWSRYRGTFYDTFAGTYKPALKLAGLDCDAIAPGGVGSARAMAYWG